METHLLVVLPETGDVGHCSKDGEIMRAKCILGVL